MKAARPSPAGERLLECIGSGSRLRDSIIGDLAEEYASRAETDGVTAADRWYRWEALRVAPHLLRDSMKHLSRGGAARMSAAVLCAFVVLLVFDAGAREAFRAVAEATGGGDSVALTPFVVALFLSWSAIDGAVAGVVAARLGSSKAIHATLMIAFLAVSAIVATGWSDMPPWFLLLNSLAVTMGALLGGVTTALSLRAGVIGR